MPQPTTLSNFSDDFVDSGLYPGGSGKITDIRYALWDYDGKRPPDSQCAVKLTMLPTDGSNDGKPVEIYSSVGPAADFQPSHDGGFVLSETRAGISKSSNWYDVAERLNKTCGLEGKDVNGAKGLCGLIGYDITLVRTDQKKRDNMKDDDPEQGQGKGRPRTILVPTRCAPGKGGASRPAAAGPVAVAPRTATPAPASPNGSGSGPFDVYASLTDIVTEAGGLIEFKLVGRAMLDKVTAAGGTPDIRKEAVTALSKANIPVTAATAGLTYDEAAGTLSL